MSEPVHGPLDVVKLEMPGEDVLKTRWEVTLQDDGALAIIACGRRPGRIHIEPGSHTSIVVTTDRITRNKARTEPP